jgi:hypothetical protein
MSMTWVHKVRLRVLAVLVAVTVAAIGAVSLAACGGGDEPSAASAQCRGSTDAEDEYRPGRGNDGDVDGAEDQIGRQC